MKKIFLFFLFSIPTLCSAQSWIKFLPGSNSFKAVAAVNGEYFLYLANEDDAYYYDQYGHSNIFWAHYHFPCVPQGNYRDTSDSWLRAFDVSPYSTDINSAFILKATNIHDCDEIGSHMELHGYKNKININSGQPRIIDGGYDAVPIASKHNLSNVYFALFDSLYISSDTGQTFHGKKYPIADSLIETYQAFPLFQEHPLISENLFIIIRSLTQNGRKINFYRTKDAGETWDNLINLEEENNSWPDEKYELIFHPTNAAKIFLRAADGVYTSSDTGSTWIKSFSEKFSSLEIDKNNPEIFFAGNTSGELFISGDSGKNFSLYNNSFTKEEIIGIFKPKNNDTLIVAARDGTYKIFGPQIVSVEENSSENFSFDISPNPFTDKTKISSSIDSPQLVRIAIFDTFGKEISSEEKFAEGKFSFDLDAKNFPSGVYFVKLSGENFSQTKMLNVVR